MMLLTDILESPVRRDSSTRDSGPSVASSLRISPRLRERNVSLFIPLRVSMSPPPYL